MLYKLLSSLWLLFGCGVGVWFYLRLVLKALPHKAIFLANCLAILLRHKLHESLPGVTYPETNMSSNFLLLS